MEISSSQIAQATFYGVMFCWLAFAAVFIFRKRPPTQTEARRDRRSTIGIFLQGCGYGAAWFGRPEYLHPEVSVSTGAELAIAVVTVALAAGSVLLVMSAVRALGKQWAVAARLVEGHKLITAGPYRFVRNPIYSAMFGMMLATCSALQHWKALPLAVLFFAVGTVIRVRIEEKLLRGAFGAEFEQYAARVPAVLPGIY